MKPLLIFLLLNAAFLIPFIVYVWWDSRRWIGDKLPCEHPILGDCSIPCPWCGTYGLYHAGYQDGSRRYAMCKYCLKMQNVGQEVQQLSIEHCEACLPDYFKEYADMKPGSENGFLPQARELPYLRITMSPGHPCGECGATMTVWYPKRLPQESLRELIYQEHKYTL